MKIVIISDTHNLTCELPVGDLLIHCGDLTKHGYRSEVYKQLGWLEEQRDKFKNAILIPGNHDFYFERHQEEAREACLAAGLIMLVNETVTIDGMKFFGTPNTNVYHDWAFNSSNKTKASRFRTCS
jgi:predicted phosphodiesterase